MDNADSADLCARAGARARARALLDSSNTYRSKFFYCP